VESSSHPRDPLGASANKLRVLFVTHSFPPAGRPLDNVGGMQRVAADLHAALGMHPRVTLTTLALRSAARWYELRTFPFLVRLTWDLARRVRTDSADVVLFSSMVTGVMSAMAARRPRAHMAAIAHGRDVTLERALHQRVWLPRSFRALDALMPVSSATAQALTDRGAEPARVHVVPNGIDPGRFTAPPARSLARSAVEGDLGLPPGALLLLAVGRQVRRKGIAWFTASVIPRLGPEVHLVVAGEGPEVEAIREAADTAGVAGRIHLLGRVSEERLATLLAGADLFVMPNVPVPGDMEGFGVVMLEAGLAGLATVASDLEGIRDVITDGANGHLVPPLDAAAFAECIARYAGDRDALERLSASAREHVVSTFSWSAVAEQYVLVLESIVRSPTRYRS